MGKLADYQNQQIPRKMKDRNKICYSFKSIHHILVAFFKNCFMKIDDVIVAVVKKR